MIFSILARLMLQNLISRITGRAARLKLPKSLQKIVNAQFASVFGINLEEAEYPIDHYGSIQELFTRRLKNGLRKIEGPICSPADGVVTQSALIKDDTRATDIKGHDYELSELVFGKNGAKLNEQSLGWYHVVYLAPHNYHRVHCPVSGRLIRIRHIPGVLWSVSPNFLGLVPNLFCRNERVVFEIENDDKQIVYVVMVGAMNVGAISSVHLPGFLSNKASQSLQEYQINTTSLQAGDELGIFHLGSTVVTLFPKACAEKYSFVQSSNNQPILMGQSLIRK